MTTPDHTSPEGATPPPQTQAAPTAYDLFNGDADGLCALHQLRMLQPRDTVLLSGTKRDIADVALFLCTDNAKYITGAIIDCDGGSGLGESSARLG